MADSKSSWATSRADRAPEQIGCDYFKPGSERHVAVIGETGKPPVATLYYGDAYTIRPSLGWMDADVMDPAYLINTKGAGSFRKRRRSMDEISECGIDKGFDLSIINPLLCGSVVTFCHNDQLADLLPYLNGIFDRYALLAWMKANPMPVANKHYRPDCEPFIHAWQRGYEPTGSLTDLRRFVIASASRKDKERFEHPTIKPDRVMNKIMSNVAGSSICDPFMGTGSTGVAAVRAGKRFVGIEHNPKYFQIAVERISTAFEELLQSEQNSN